MTSSNSANHAKFGDSPPPPPDDKKQPLATRIPGRIVYGARAAWLRMTHLRRPAPVVPAPDQVRRLVAVQLEHMGDLILAEPTLRALRMHYPNAERVLIARDFARDLFAGSGWGEVWPERALTRLREEPGAFDVAVDLTGRVETRIARTLKKAQIPVRVGHDRGGRGVYHTIPRRWPGVHVPMRELYARLASSLGADVRDTLPRLPRDEARLERGWEAWSRLRIKDPVVLMPGAATQPQRWLVEKFAQVARSLKQAGAQVAVITGPGEDALGERIMEDAGVSFIQRPPVSELMDLLATSRVVLCNNTGPLHLAAALGVPTVSTMGPAVPWRWWPVSTAPTIVFRGGTWGPRGDLNAIDPLEVSAAVLHLLEQEPAVRRT